MQDWADRSRERLLAGKYRGTETGVWQIFGEDPNCDLGGAHHEPLLGTAQGTYASAIEYALGMTRFFTWGGGGRIERVDIVKVDGESLRSRALLTSRRLTLKAQLEDVEAELKKLGVG